MRKYLIVIDMQNDFTYGALRNEETIKIIPAVLDKVNAFDGKVVFTRDTHYDDYLETQEGKLLPVPHCKIDTEGWQLIDGLNKIQADKNYKVFDKITFGSTELAKYLAEENEKSPIDEIELVGVCTDICVISNAMLIKAHLPNIKLVVDSKCCAGVTVDSHNTALKAMEACQIIIK